MKESPGRKAAQPDTLEADREIVVSFKLRTHGSTDHANSFIEHIRRQLSVLVHADIEILEYDVDYKGKNEIDSGD